MSSTATVASSTSPVFVTRISNRTLSPTRAGRSEGESRIFSRACPGEETRAGASLVLGSSGRPLVATATTTARLVVSPGFVLARAVKLIVRVALSPGSIGPRLAHVIVPPPAASGAGSALAYSRYVGS